MAGLCPSMPQGCGASGFQPYNPGAWFVRPKGHKSMELPVARARMGEWASFGASGFQPHNPGAWFGHMGIG
ncbi:hypothetical protein DUNSADRAFT_7968 [Dunaliella salina]|uniref:Encoded protein n=1 Tax=Dunaliella salina TaxID=3046 RepID=A0ABQ7H632_DUNSA|nr:hypothetical protein DUNSADRAFT_7968 [Dunaliella salina]|eukprot:KAF5842315.1 hypothetical protein DUNSADRAFT_7968 [Dunaliella salina]